MKELALACDVSARTVSAWEKGDAVPKPETLKRLASVLSVPVDFFICDEPPQLRAEDVSFRALSAMTARERDQALAAGILAFELSDYFDSRFTSPTLDVPDLTGERPETAATRLRQEWGLGDKPIANVTHLLESKGVRIFSLVEGIHNLDAFATWYSHKPFAFINTSKSAERGRFDLAHELGHLSLHQHQQTVRNRTFELEADRFSGAFLMPASALYARVPRRTTLDLVMIEKQYWGVPAMAYVVRLFELQLISEWHYRSYCIELSKRGFRSEEPGGRPNETSLLLTKMFKLLREEHMTSAQLATQLRLSESELTELVFGLVLTTMPGQELRTVKRRDHLHLLRGGSG